MDVEELPTQPDPLTGQPRPSRAPVPMGLFSMKQKEKPPKEQDADREHNRSWYPSAPDGEGPLLEWYRGSRWNALRSAAVVTLILIVRLCGAQLGFAWMAYWLPWGSSSAGPRQSRVFAGEFAWRGTSPAAGGIPPQPDPGCDGLPTGDRDRRATVERLAATRSSSTSSSGRLARRPKLDKALLAANRTGDQLVVTKLDCLGRSLEHLIELSKQLQAKQVDLVVLDQGIDTSTAVGRLFFSIIGAIAEFERTLMSECIIDRLPAARTRDRTPDRRAVPASSQSRVLAGPVRRS